MMTSFDGLPSHNRTAALDLRAPTDRRLQFFAAGGRDSLAHRAQRDLFLFLSLDLCNQRIYSHKPVVEVAR